MTVSFLSLHFLRQKKNVAVPDQNNGGRRKDAGAIHVSRGGVKTAAVSLPCRYLHSPSCVINKADFENAYVLTKLILDRTYNK